ncbi:MAG: nicotinate phosphoribosyltransferase [Bacteroidia bacterium]|nr:nicotinate phosphoribosyltransferase [Bacteroidia bacterium]
MQNYSLLTDLYQLTMAYGYWKTGLKDHETVFHLFFRKHPFQGGYTLACGLQPALDLIRHFSFKEDDLAYLSTLKGNDGKPLFDSGFLEYLGKLENTLTVYGIPEGTVVFPHEPLLRLQGPIILCQLLETPLLNILNFQTLIATKASRIAHVAQGESVLEFGLRRAQGVDGGLAASRAAYIGGCAATSNVLAGKMYGIPVRGTHAHSWVMSFPTEQEAFEAYAQAMPNNCVFLVDTYDTLEGVKNAIGVGKKLREEGHEMVGIRLDSGDLATLSIEARKLLDEAGFPAANIVASNDLDEYEMKTLKEKGSRINVWGVGTRLVTAYDQPALGGVYKLAAIRKPGENWSYKVKLSEQAIKVSNPGILQVRRFRTNNHYTGDIIFHEEWEPARCRFEAFSGQQMDIQADHYEDLLVPVWENGKQVYHSPDIHTIREHRKKSLELFEEKILTPSEPSVYPTGLEPRLQEYKLELMRTVH